MPHSRKTSSKKSTTLFHEFPMMDKYGFQLASVVRMKIHPSTTFHDVKLHVLSELGRKSGKMYFSKRERGRSGTSVPIYLAYLGDGTVRENGRESIYDQLNSISIRIEFDLAPKQEKKKTASKAITGSKWGMFSAAGNLRVANIFRDIKQKYDDIGLAWTHAQSDLVKLGKDKKFTEATDSAVLEAMYEAVMKHYNGTKHSSKKRATSSKKRDERPSPSTPAKEAANLCMKGNDGNFWCSVADKNGVFHWKKSK